MSDEPVVHHPPNWENAFNGVDWTKAKFSQESFKMPLFDPPAGQDKNHRVHPPELSEAIEYAVPKDLRFFWYQEERSITGVSESRHEFLKEINKEDSINVGVEIPEVLGFNAEYSRTFNESHNVETYKKYAASYISYTVYSLEWFDNPKTHLNEQAEKDLNGSTMDARKVVEKYGTHFMTSTTFGGLKICAATLDVRNTVDRTKLTNAIKIKFNVSYKKADGKGGVEHEDSDEETLKISKKLEETRNTIYGGLSTTNEDDPQWKQSLFKSPAICDYKLSPISELVSDPKRKEAIKKAIKDYTLSQGVPDEGKEIIAMKVPLKSYANFDDKNLSLARPEKHDGYFYTGQFFLPESNGFKNADYTCLTFANGTKACANGKPAIQPAAGWKWFWGHIYRRPGTMLFRNICFYRAVGDDEDYVSLGDVVEEIHNLRDITNTDYYGLINKELVETLDATDGRTWECESKESGKVFMNPLATPRDIKDWIYVPEKRAEPHLFITSCDASIWQVYQTTKAASIVFLRPDLPSVSIPQWYKINANKVAIVPSRWL